jgi:hypothetical protein
MLAQPPVEAGDSGVVPFDLVSGRVFLPAEVSLPLEGGSPEAPQSSRFGRQLPCIRRPRAGQRIVEMRQRIVEMSERIVARDRAR